MSKRRTDSLNVVQCIGLGLERSNLGLVLGENSLLLNHFLVHCIVVLFHLLRGMDDLTPRCRHVLLQAPDFIALLFLRER